MVNVLKNILTQRPDNLLANFEMISRHTKQDTFKGDEDRLLDDDVKSNAFDIASNQKNLFTKSDEAEEMEAEVRNRILKIKLMLVTDVGDNFWRQFSGVGDGILILVTSFGCWCPTLMLKDRSCW